MPLFYWSGNACLRMSTWERDDIFDVDLTAVSVWDERLRRWLWPIVGFTAWVVFELTSELWASTLVLCAHYAWAPFSTGCWLWWHDPWRQRGRSSLLAFCGHAVGRMLLAGFVMTVFLSPLAFGNPAIEKAVMAVLFMLSVGLILMVILLWMALIMARLSGVRLWVNGLVHRSARGQWPPTRTGYSNRIKLGFWLSSCLAVPAVSCAMFLPIILRALDPDAQTLATLLVCLGSYVLVFVFYASIAGPSIARDPGDCWPEFFDNSAAATTPYSHQN